MKTPTRRIIVIGLVLTLVFVFAASAVAYTAAEEFKRTSLIPYYSVVKDEPYAAYTTLDDIKRTSLLAYYSVVKDEPYAAYTTLEDIKRTSLLPYYSVVH